MRRQQKAGSQRGHRQRDGRQAGRVRNPSSRVPTATRPKSMDRPITANRPRAVPGETPRSIASGNVKWTRWLPHPQDGKEDAHADDPEARLRTASPSSTPEWPFNRPDRTPTSRLLAREQHGDRNGCKRDGTERGIADPPTKARDDGADEGRCQSAAKAVPVKARPSARPRYRSKNVPTARVQTIPLVPTPPPAMRSHVM